MNEIFSFSVTFCCFICVLLFFLQLWVFWEQECILGEKCCKRKVLKRILQSGHKRRSLHLSHTPSFYPRSHSYYGFFFAFLHGRLSQQNGMEIKASEWFMFHRLFNLSFSCSNICFSLFFWKVTASNEKCPFYLTLLRSYLT